MSLSKINKNRKPKTAVAAGKLIKIISHVGVGAANQQLKKIASGVIIAHSHKIGFKALRTVSFPPASITLVKICPLSIYPLKLKK